MPGRFTKQPLESYTIAVEFAGKLPSGATLASGTVSAVRMDNGATDNSVLASTTMTIVGTQARVKVQGGLSGIDYKLTCLITLSNSDLLEEDVTMEVESL